MQSPHPNGQILQAYGLGKLDDASARTIHDHLETCDDCRKQVAGFTSDTFLDRFREINQRSARLIPPGSMVDGTLSFAQAKVTSSPPPAETLPLGLVDHPDYEIKRELGRGGMGVVYLAHNTMMGRDEVLKVMGRHIMERPGVLERFQREIRAVAKLRHPNIVAAYHAFRIDGGLVFSMEYVEGLDLAHLVKTKGPLTVAQATYFIHQAALGLQHAHEKGLIHRDIKPHNLMLTHDGKARLIKVLDFGLAKATREQTVESGLTSEGQALGTPDYIAPEQILNALDVDIRADLYSLGGTLFYLLIGRPPFQATSLYDIYQAHMSRDAEPLNLIRPEVPAELAALVAQMMAKEPSKRFQTPADVAQALTPFFKTKPVKVETLQAEPGLSKIIDHPTPTEPSTNAEFPDRRFKQLADAPTTQWESLIDFREPEPVQETPIVAPRAVRSRWIGFSVASAVLLFSLVIAWWAARSASEVKVETTPNSSEMKTVDVNSLDQEKEARSLAISNTPRVDAEKVPEVDKTRKNSGRVDGVDDQTLEGEVNRNPDRKPIVLDGPRAEDKVAISPKPQTDKSSQIRPGLTVEGEWKTRSAESKDNPSSYTLNGTFRLIIVTMEESRFTGEYHWLTQADKSINVVQSIHGMFKIDGTVEVICDKNLKGKYYLGWQLEGKVEEDGKFHANYVREETDTKRKGLWTGQAVEKTLAEKVQGTGSTVTKLDPSELNSGDGHQTEGEKVSHKEVPVKSPAKSKVSDGEAAKRAINATIAKNKEAELIAAKKKAAELMVVNKTAELVKARNSYKEKTNQLREMMINLLGAAELEAKQTSKTESLTKIAKQRAEFDHDGTIPDVVNARDYYNKLLDARTLLEWAVVGARDAYLAATMPDQASKLVDELKKIKKGESVCGVALHLKIEPDGDFVPRLTNLDQEEWFVLNKRGLKVQRDGIILSAGEGGNCLVTKAQDYRASLLEIEIACDRGTEAFSGLRLFQADDGWHGSTSRIFVDDGMIWAGGCGQDFKPNEDSRTVRQSFAFFEFFSQVTVVNDSTNMHVDINGKRKGTGSVLEAWKKGAVGIFVKSGAVKIRKLVVRRL